MGHVSKGMVRAKTMIVVLGCVMLCACSGPQSPVYDPTLGVHVARGGAVHPTAAANLGPLRIGGGANGGIVSTGWGPLRLSKGF